MHAPDAVLHDRAPHLRAGAIRWAALVFLVGFAVLLIVVVSLRTSSPAMEAAQDATPPRRSAALPAWSRLLLSVVLFILFAGLVLTFRFGRFFFPRAAAPRTQTQYVDAWAESGKRIESRRGRGPTTSETTTTTR